jgi:hypothetical protein
MDVQKIDSLLWLWELAPSSFIVDKNYNNDNGADNITVLRTS